MMSVSLLLNAMHSRRLTRKILSNYFTSLLLSFDSIIALGIWTASIVALFVHKCTIIQLHGPLPTLSLICFAPFLFVFDFITVLLLYRGLTSANKIRMILAGFVGVVIMCCSATFLSLYLEANAEVNWGRSVEILSDWEIYSKIMAQGRGFFDKLLISYLMFGGSAMIARHAVRGSLSHSPLLSKIPEIIEPAQGLSLRRVFKEPLAKPILFLLFGTLFLPQQPWRHLTSTLLYDVVSSTTSVIITKTIRDLRGECKGDVVGASPFGEHYYNAAEDPYYISNLDSPIDPFIEQALEGIQFTNVVHIVLESMRTDSYPWDEHGALHDHIRKNYKLVEGGTEITTSNVTPFIQSLASSTISWETVFALIPFTHKAMIGHYCGQLALPIDFTVELEEPAKMYQTCLPQVFRHLNSVTDTESEILSLINGTRPPTTDQWETVHIESATGRWDNEKTILQYAGFNTVVTAEDLNQIRNLGEFDSSLGYFDERSLELFWKYVDNTRARVPKNRMYLGWMTTTTHSPFLVPEDWAEANRQSFVHDDDRWSSIDGWLNAIRWTDDKIKEIILGFRERGLENETLFFIHGDHGFPFTSKWATTIENPHNEVLRVPFMIYNPNIKNPEKKKIEGNFYSLSIPTTILDIMIHTKSFAQSAQQTLARRFAEGYEHAQSLLRPVKETIRFFFVHPGGTQWVLDNGRNLRCTFNLDDNRVHLADYVADPLEMNGMDSWDGVEDLISKGAEDKFGVGTTEFLKNAFERQIYMKKEILRRYGI